MSVHVAKSLFFAGIDIFCYKKYASKEQQDMVLLSADYKFAELQRIEKKNNMSLLRDAYITDHNVNICQMSLYSMCLVLSR